MQHLARVLRWKHLFYLLNNFKLSYNNLQDDITYDLAIVGGGLAGLVFIYSIGQKGTVLFCLKKNNILFIKFAVNISVLNHGIFLQDLGVDLRSLNVSHIKRLQVSAQNGNSLNKIYHWVVLESVVMFDHTFAQIAK